MLAQTRQFSVLFSAVVVLLAGHGLQLTLLPLRAQALGWDVTLIGITGSCYFLGFLAGCVLVPRFVAAVGHIRVFSTTTTVCGCALILILVSDHWAVWSGLRFLTGIGISGCYIIIESWLNEQTGDQSRGRVLATYSIIVLVAMSAGQLLVNLGGPVSIVPVILGSVLLSCAVVPLSLTRVEQPKLPKAFQLKLADVYAASPASVGAALTIGMVTGVLFTLTPVASVRFGLDTTETSILMVTLVLGGALLQFPAGRLSDGIDRRKVMIGLLVLGVGIAIAALPWRLGFWTLSGIILILGGVANAIYPICLAHANDRYPGHFLQVGTVILMANSAGAVMGPVMASIAMDILQDSGFFVFLLLGMLATLSWLVYCIMQRTVAPEPAAAFVATAKSSPALFSMDPRAALSHTGPNEGSK